MVFNYMYVLLKMKPVYLYFVGVFFQINFVANFQHDFNFSLNKIYTLHTNMEKDM